MKKKHPRRAIGIALLALAGLVISASQSIAQEKPASLADSTVLAKTTDILSELESTVDQLNQTTDMLKNGQVEPFLASFQSTVKQYVDATVNVRNFTRQNGQAQIQVEFALANLEDLIDDTDANLIEDWKAELVSQRTDCLNELAALGQQKDATIDQLSRLNLASQQQSTLIRLNMLDDWLAPAGTTPAENVDTIKQAYQALTLQKQRLQSDAKLATLAGEILTRKMALCKRDIDRGLRLMTAQVQLPRKADQQFVKTGRSVESLLNGILNSRRSTRLANGKAAEEIATPDNAAEIATSAMPVSASQPIVICHPMTLSTSSR